MSLLPLEFVVTCHYCFLPAGIDSSARYTMDPRVFYGKTGKSFSLSIHIAGQYVTDVVNTMEARNEALRSFFRERFVAEVGGPLG